MSLSTPKITVTCDSCDTESDFELTELAMDGVYDTRNLKDELEEEDWITVGKKHYCCDSCREDDENPEPEDEEDDDEY